ncbi:serine/threonine protein kinase [Dermacoccus abyssi]|uniref:serine/threonine-protein kinase n=1 Tax=Dermacoccus abyssi TaxID=322596 RepID=UPI0021A2BDC3|nr:serine/threonine protein kinase [Dermacoccus abyssi]
MSESWQLGSRYVLERRIGAGAMGQVWAGRDVDGRPLAFKLLRPEMADDPTVVARFLQERNLLVNLRSPHVIRVHDLVVEGPRLAIVMDYIGGPSLRGLLQQRGNLPPAEVASLGSRIAAGLAAVHGAGVLHRDLKPENVLLDETPNGLEPKLADFGIASLAVTATGHVGTANVIGTPQYLAPELGDGLPSGRASDLYALGITLYEMACGIVPFSSDSPVALLRMHADHAPGRPDGMPDELWHLVAALMAKNPGDRPDDASAVAAQLADMVPRFAGMPAPAPLHASPPTRLIGSALPTSGSSPETVSDDHDESTSHRRSIALGVGLVVGLCLVALVAWLLLRDTGSEQTKSKPSTTTSSSTTRAQPTVVPLSSRLAGSEAEKNSATIDGRDFDDAVVARDLTPPTCTRPVRFTLDGEFTQMELLAGFNARPNPSGDTGAVVVRLDGDTKQTVNFSSEKAKALSLDVTGVRSLVLELRAQRCSPQDHQSIALAEGKLRRQ